MSLFRRRIIERYINISIDSLSLTRPVGNIRDLTVIGGSDDVSVIVGGEVEYTKPSKVMAYYYNNNISTTVRYKGLSSPNIISSNTNVISVGTVGAESCSITAIGQGSATITIKDGEAVLKTYTITVTNDNTEFDVTGSVTYSASNSNITLLS